MYELKTNNPTRIVVGPAVNVADNTARLDLDVTEIIVQICRMAQDGSAVAMSAFTPTVSGGDNDMVHISGDTAGMYDLELTASQLNFLGPARIILYDENEFIIHWVDILVLSAAYYDWKYGTTKPEVDLVLIDGEAIDVTEAQLGVNVVEADSIAWEDEERLSKLDAMQENITDIKRVTDNISTSNMAARDNTEISAATGYAFVDFGDAAIFTNHIASHSKLTIVDSAGKKLTGYVKAAGTGEVWNEKISENDRIFTDGTVGNWQLHTTGGGGGSLVYDAMMEAAKVTVGATVGTANGAVMPPAARGILVLNGAITVTEADVYLPSGHSFTEALAIQGTTYPTLGNVAAIPLVVADLNKTDEWQFVRSAAFLTANTNTGNFYFFNRGGVTGNFYFFKNYSLKQLVAPSATGVTITSTPDGDTQDWASIEDGFDFYDAAGYTITLPGNQPDLLYTEKKLMLTNLDAKVSTRSTLTAAQVWANTTRTLTAISDSAGIATLLSRISQALGFTAGNVNVHIKAKDNIDFGALEKTSLNAATPAVTVSDKTDFALTSAYDAAKTAATQTSVNAIPTTPLLSTDARLDNLDATITSRLASASYIAPPSASDIRSEIDSSSTKLDVAISTRLAAIDYESIEDIEEILDRLDTMLEADGEDGNYKFTEAALAEAPVATDAPTVTEIRNEMDDNSTKLSNLDATVSSRLAAISYTTPPTAVSIRTEIDANSTKLDVAVGTRLATASYTAPNNTDIENIKAVTDKLDDTLELEDGVYKFTEASLIDAPTGSGSITVEDIAEGILDAKLSDHEEVGSVGAGIAAAGSAGDPWATELPGSYGNNTAGKIIGDNINATVASRLAAINYTAPPSASDIRTEIDTNSTKLDVAVGTRLATAGYTAPNNTDIGNIKTIADKLDTMLEADGSDYKFTEEALSEVPVASDAPTVIEIRNELDSNSTKLANLDTTISSRLATTSYTAPPTAANIRNEIDVNSTKLDATISSRLAALDYNSPPTVAQIRNEMDSSSTKLANLDATISSRLAENVYTAPPSASDIRSEIDSNSTKLDMAISTRLAAIDYEAPDNEAIADIKEIAEILDSLIEDSDGSRFTAKALEQAPITTLTVADIVNGVLDEALLSHQQSGSVGAGISAAGSAGDPWATILPGAYPEGTAGYVMGTNLLNPGTGNNIWLYRLVDEDTTEPIIGALVVASTDIAGNIIIATAVTDTRGIVRFNLNSGTYYLWRRHVNYEFTDPDIEVVP